MDVSRAKAAAARRKTLRMHEGNRHRVSVLECASPLALWNGAHMCRTKLINHENLRKNQFMNEEPKSIWKKSWTLPGLFLAWLILMVATMAIFVLILFISNDSGCVYLSCWFLAR